MALIFDTETSGKADFDKPDTDISQPSLVQLGMILVDTANWIPKLQASMLIQDVTSIEPQAEAIHGISVRDCQRYGVPQQVALQLFSHLFHASDCLVAHNYEFDRRIMAAAMHRGGTGGLLAARGPSSAAVVDWDAMPHVCTMKASTDIVKLPGLFNENDYKWPSLAEAYHHFTDSELEGGHDALVDAEACLTVFKSLVEAGAVELAEREAGKDDRIARELKEMPNRKLQQQQQQPARTKASSSSTAIRPRASNPAPQYDPSSSPLTPSFFQQQQQQQRRTARRHCPTWWQDPVNCTC